MDEFDELALVLENDGMFYNLYIAIKNENGRSGAVLRRSLITDAVRTATNRYVKSTEEITYRLEKYFNERWNLCPYCLTKSIEPKSQPEPRPQLIQETFMSTAQAIKTITYVYGKPSTDVSDDEIFSHIARIEGEIKKLGAVENKPKKLAAKIDAMHAEIKGLIELVDNR